MRSPSSSRGGRPKHTRESRGRPAQRVDDPGAREVTELLALLGMALLVVPLGDEAASGGGGKCGARAAADDGPVVLILVGIGRKEQL